MDKSTSAMITKEGARSATGIITMAGTTVHLVRHLLVLKFPKKTRCKFTIKYKLVLLAEADACTQPGKMGVLLRHEGLYSSNLTTWRQQREKGILQAMTLKKDKLKMINS